jgi:hypothetical protein
LPNSEIWGNLYSSADADRRRKVVALNQIIGDTKMKAYQVTKESYSGTGQVSKPELGTFSSQEAAQKYIDGYVAKRGGNIHKLTNDFGQRGSVEFVITEVNDFYI